MTDRPIIFSSTMVRALLEGRKTMTRRIIKPRGRCSIFDGSWTDDYVLDPGNSEWRAREIPFAVGDRLYVRETFGRFQEFDDQGPCSETMTYFRADGEPFERWLDPDTDEWRDGCKWKPAIHMPREASRITLTVEAVKVERLQDISEEDAIAEGIWVQRLADWAVKGQLPKGELIAVDDPAEVYMIEPEPHGDAAWATAKQAYMVLWDYLNFKRAPWESDPWVVVPTFTVHKCNIDRMPA